ncbi:MAG: glycosyltransferase family 4 protein [Bernardetiaceae bacterium]|jgi:glycosyltransferase involved in cell wall biosynthesis|nr:glycosyltransferase family 4 protein [Bernardetiaceae bacterium]
MRIGIVINAAWNIYNFRSGLIESFIQSGHQVVAIAPQDQYTERIVNLGCEFIAVPMDSKGSNPLRDTKLVWDLYQAYRRAELDVVLHYTIKPNIYGTLAAKMLGIPCINNVTGLGTVFIRSNFTSWVAHQLYRAVFRLPEAVFFQNKDDRQLFIERNFVRQHITDVLPGSGVDLSRFKPRETPRNHRFTFLLVARMLYDKGILEYIEAARLLQAQGLMARFQLLGKVEPDKGLGVPQETLDGWVREGLVEYLGTSDDVVPIMEKADCVILPSYREGTPRTLLEAASMGKPIIATNVPGCRDTVEHGFNGFLCNVKDPHDLAKKMEDIMHLGEQPLRRMGQNSRQLAVDRFDQKIIIRKYQAALRSLMAAPALREELAVA